MKTIIDILETIYYLFLMFNALYVLFVFSGMLTLSFNAAYGNGVHPETQELLNRHVKALLINAIMALIFGLILIQLKKLV